MELFVKIVQGWKPATFLSKISILDLLLVSKYASGFKTVHYFHRKLHLKFLTGLWICLCLYWVWQFWIHEISKLRSEETQKNVNKHVRLVTANSCSKIFVKFQGKHPRGKTLTKLQVTWNFLRMFSWKICIFRTASIKTTTNGGFCNMLLLSYPISFNKRPSVLI